MQGFHITITGDLGSGKSSVSRELCKRLGFEYLSTGLIQRQIARSKGMNTLELNKYSENHKEVDDFIDNKLISLNEVEDLHVLDSRLAWHFVKRSFKIYLTATPEIAARRVLADKDRTEEPEAGDIASKIADLKERRSLENKRFKRIYDIECDDFRNYDLIIDSSHAPVAELADYIIRFYQDWQNGTEINQTWLTPKRLYPLPGLEPLEGEIAEGPLTTQEPIEVLWVKENYFVWSGHGRLSNSLQQGASLVPVLRIAEDEDATPAGIPAANYVAENLDFAYLKDWELRHDFRFQHMPGISPSSDS